MAAARPTLTAEDRPEFRRTRIDLLLLLRHWIGTRAAAHVRLKLEPHDGSALLAVGRTYMEKHDFARAAFERRQGFRNRRIAHWTMSHKEYYVY
ncbi:MAG: hypothetical protein ACREFX_02215 [Opitutaceae bacterium]